MRREHLSPSLSKGLNRKGTPPYGDPPPEHYPPPADEGQSHGNSLDSQPFPLVIEKMIYGGWGLARQTLPGVSGTRTIFLPDVLPGEEIQAEFTSFRKDYARAKPIRILASSPYRRIPPCPAFGTCGGCHLQHMNESAQLAYKQEVLVETLQRIGQIQAPPVPVICASEAFGYRHRVQFKLEQTGSGLKLGFYQRESHRIVSPERCPVLHPDLEHAVTVLRDFLGAGLPFLRNPAEMHLHYSQFTGQTLVIIYAEEAKRGGLGSFFGNLKTRLPVAGIVVYARDRQRLVCGRPFLMHRLKEFVFRVSDRTFVQPNWSMNEIITDSLLRFAGLSGKETVLELYSGMGNFSLFLARQARKVIALEGHAQAAKDARYNARQNKVINIESYRCDVEGGLATCLKNRLPIDLLVLDPPRQGAGQHVLRQICDLNPPRILYLSCDPATLARDLKYLGEHRYRLERHQSFDLLPQTYHLEILAELVRT